MTKGFTQASVDSCATITFDIHFKKGSVVLTPLEKRKLDSVFKIMKPYPRCKFFVQGHGRASEGGQQISWDKVASVVRYLRGKGIKKENFLFEYGIEGDPAIVNLTSSTEEGPDWVPAPHPCFSLHLPPKKRCVNADGEVLH